MAQVVSAEAIKRSPDRNTGEVLKRVSGASLQEGKYLVVRGLADRYNQATLNGALLSSTEPDRKTFSFDLFPAAIIDNIVINKAAVPELPGEFAGGLVQVNTRDIPSENFLTVQIGTGANAQTAGREFLKNNVGRKDFLGMDDGSRALLSAYPGTKSEFDNTPVDGKVDYSKALSNNFGITRGSAPVNANAQVAAGLTHRINDGDFGVVVSLNYSKSNRRTETMRNDYNIDGSASYNFMDEKYGQDVLWGALANLSYSRNKSKISFKNLYNTSASNYVTFRTGTDQTGPFDIRGYELGFITNTIYSSQLSGEHLLKNTGGIKLRWNGSYTRIGQSTPDLRRLNYQSNAGENNFEANIPQGSASLTSAGRFFSELNDNVYSGSMDLSKPFKLAGMQQTIKAGAMYQMKDRAFTPRALGYIADRSNPYVNEVIIRQPIEQIFSRENMGTNLLRIDETTNAKDKYDAGSMLTAGYLQLDNQISDKLQITWGSRLEHYEQEIRYHDGNTAQAFKTSVTDILPSANLKYALNEKTNLRLSGSQTVIRPEFRELSEFRFYNFDLLATEGGNPNLQRTKVTNADLRYEIYPAQGEFITAGVFYKYFSNPIEKFFNTTGAGSQSLIYNNTPSAQSAGAELEFRKSLRFIHDDEESVWKNLFVFANGAYILNRVSFAENSLLKERPMQGQSDYVINGGISADITSSGTNLSFLVNRIGRRIFLVGNGPEQPNIWEAPRTLLDFQVSQKFLKKAEVKLSISDILNRSANFY
ncbi:MAG: TonB-dependent receptor, partial [Sphingobacteriales bacterium]